MATAYSISHVAQQMHTYYFTIFYWHRWVGIEAIENKYIFFIKKKKTPNNANANATNE